LEVIYLDGGIPDLFLPQCAAMLISIFAGGSVGDVLPLIALSKGLKRASFRIRFCVHAHFEPLVRENELDFFPLPGNSPQTVVADELRKQPRTPIGKVVRVLTRKSQPTDEDIGQIRDGCVGSDAVIFTPMSWIAFHIAEQQGIPAIGAYLHPTWPTSSFPSSHGLPPFKLGGAYNRLTHLFMEQLFWMNGRSWVNHWRGTIGLPRISWRGPRYAMQQKGVPILFGISRHWIERPEDWPDWLHVVGFWVDPSPTKYEAEKGLAAFIAGGDRPISIGFGSMIDPRTDATLSVILEALRATNQRAVLISGWNRYTQKFPDSVYETNFVPYSWLFGKVSAAIHAAGAGTVAHALMAGVPSIPIPFQGEQNFYAARLHQKGVAPKPILLKRLSREAVRERLKGVLGDPSYRIRAEEISCKVRSENGVDNAVGIISTYLRRKSSPTSSRSV
jgi:sterol 3beta-glucosyltransferase